MGFRAVDGWPEVHKPAGGRRPPGAYVQALEDLKANPNRIGVVRHGLTQSKAASMRRWLNGHEGVKARTTGRRSQLERYGYTSEVIAGIIAEAKEQGETIDPDSFHVVVAQYMNPDA